MNAVLKNKFCSQVVLSCLLAAWVGMAEKIYAASLVWSNSPAATSTWSTSGADTNWSGSNFANNDDVTFSGAGLGSIAIPSNVTQTGMVFNHGAGTYTLTGAGGIGGTGALNKSGAGILAFQNAANTFSGGINWNGGEIQFTNANQLGSTAVTMQITENSKLNFNPGGNTGTTVAIPVNIAAGKVFTLTRENGQHFPSYSGKISGDGGIRVEGATANYWNFTNNTNDFSGGITIASGVIFSGDGTFGNNPVINIENGSTFTVTAATTGSGRTFNLVSGQSTFGSSGGMFSGLITGAGVLRANNLWLNNAGNNYASTTMAGIANGNLRIGVAGSIGSGAIAFDSNNNNTITFTDAVGGTFNNTINWSTGTRTVTVNEASAFINYTGNLNATGGDTQTITKNGLGTFAVTNWNVTNPLNVAAGRFLFNDTTTANLNNFVVDADATFGGDGTLVFGAGKSLTVNGSLQPGNNGAGTLTVHGPLTLGSTAVLDFQLGASGNDLVHVNGALTLDGALQVTPNGAFGLEGETYTLFTYTGLLNDLGLNLIGLPNAVLDLSTPGFVNLYFPIPIPEPASAWLVGLSLLACGRKLRRRG